MTEYATGITKYVIKISHDIDLSVDFRKPVDVRNKRELLVETGKECEFTRIKHSVAESYELLRSLTADRKWEIADSFSHAL